MKRMLIYGLILVLLWFVPVKGEEIADLEPIQAVWLSRNAGEISLKTDTEDAGAGKTVAEALEQMKTQSTGAVYLDTAQFLLVSENALDLVEEIKPMLKGKVLVCRWEGGDLKAAAKYMESREMGVKLRKWSKDVKLPKIPI